MNAALSKLGSLVARAVASGITGGILWFVVSRSIRINGQAALQLVPWPVGEWWLWVSVGLAIGLLLEAIRIVRQQRRGQELQTLCERLGFTYQPASSAVEWEQAHPLARFTNTMSVAHCVQGEVAGTSFQMVDHRRRIVEGRSSNVREETVAVFDVSDADLPTFELQPRTILLRVMTAAGMAEISLSNPAQPSPATSATESTRIDEEEEEDPYEIFRDAYHLSLGPRERAQALAGESESTLDDIERVRRLFDRQLVAFLSERPQWHIESFGGQLAIWRPQRVVASNDCPSFLAEAIALRTALVAGATSPLLSAAEASSAKSAAAGGSLSKSSVTPTSAFTEPENDASDISQAPTLFAGTIFGGVVGFASGGMAGAVAAMSIVTAQGAQNQGPATSTAILAMAVFFGSAVLGLVVGGLAGRKVLGRLLSRMRGRTRPVSFSDPASSAWQPPEGSRARVERFGEEVRIEFPALGPLHGSGCFLTFWSGCWNLFLLVLTPFFLHSAWQGGVKNEAGQAQSPFAVALFLIPFWLVGLGSMLAIAYQSRQRSVFIVAPGRLRVERVTIFGQTDYDWTVSELQSIESSTYEVRNSRLVIRAANRPAVALLGEHTSAERRWLAQLLRSVSGLAQSESR